MRIPATVIPLLLAILLPSCAASRVWFAPRENLRAESPRGYPPLQHDLQVEGGEVRAKVWSEGAYFAEVGDDEVPLVHLGLEIDNQSGHDLQVLANDCRLIELEIDDGPNAALQPFDLPGKLDVPAGKVGLVDLEFQLPDDVRPGHLRSFRAEWNVGTTGGEPITRSTPFRRASPRSYYNDGYWPGYWGYGAVRFGLYGGYHAYPRSRFWWGPRFGWWW